MTETKTGCLIKLRSILPSLAKVHRRIAELILEDPGGTIQISVTELAGQVQASEASVVLFCKKLGFRGYHDFKISLAEELYKSAGDVHEEIESTDKTPDIIKKVFNSSIQALKDSLKILNQDAVSEAARSISSSKKILIMGIGISGMIAKDFWMKLFRIRLNVNYHDNQTTMKMAAALAEPGDVIFVISHSGSTRVVVDILKMAREQGVTTIGLTNFLNSPITKYIDTLLLTSSRETGVREEEMTARITQLAVIDAIFVTIANSTYTVSSEALKKSRAAVSSDKMRS
jgi:RpiR family transcriptional regulator, carbohydrate utilization regulator